MKCLYPRHKSPWRAFPSMIYVLQHTMYQLGIISPKYRSQLLWFLSFFGLFPSTQHPSSNDMKLFFILWCWINIKTINHVWYFFKNVHIIMILVVVSFIFDSFIWADICTKYYNWGDFIVNRNWMFILRNFIILLNRE